MGTRGFLAEKFKMAALLQLVKLFSRKRRAVEEFLSRFRTHCYVSNRDYKKQQKRARVEKRILEDERIPKLGQSLFQEKAEGVTRHVSV